MSCRIKFLKPSFHFLLDIFPNMAEFHFQEVCLSALNQVSKQKQRHLCCAQSQRGATGCRVCCWENSKWRDRGMWQQPECVFVHVCACVCVYRSLSLRRLWRFFGGWSWRQRRWTAACSREKPPAPWCRAAQSTHRTLHWDIPLLEG